MTIWSWTTKASFGQYLYHLEELFRSFNPNDSKWKNALRKDNDNDNFEFKNELPIVKDGRQTIVENKP